MQKNEQLKNKILKKERIPKLNIEKLRKGQEMYTHGNDMF